jgi:hypothetical protein
MSSWPIPVKLCWKEELPTCHKFPFDDLSLTFSTGINEPESEALVCYPNPFRDWLKVSWKPNTGSEVHIILRDVRGRNGCRTDIECRESLFAFPDLPAGLYLLSGEQGEKSVTYKL